MSLTFTLVTPHPSSGSRPTCSPCPSAPTARSGPGADVVDAALDGDLAAFMEEAGFEGKPGPDAGGADAAVGCRAAAALLVGVGAFDEITPTALRRAAAAVARRADEGWRRSRRRSSISPTGPGSSAADAAQAVAEGFVLGSYQFLKYKGDGDAEPLERRGRRRPGGAPRRGRARPGRDRRGRGRMGARHGQRAVGRQVAGGVRRRGRRSSCAARASR